MSGPLAVLREGARLVLARPLTEPEVESFGQYLRLLIKWQRVQRLVGSSDPLWIVDNLFLDSLLFLKVLPEAVGSILDLGSGPGVPGIPIKIVRPRIGLTLVESRRRRASFLSAVVRELRLADVTVLHMRAEELIKEGRQLDAVVMRCAGDLDSLFRVARGLLKHGGVIVASGPPAERPLEHGRWIRVPGAHPDSVRLFAVSASA